MLCLDIEKEAKIEASFRLCFDIVAIAAVLLSKVGIKRLAEIFVLISSLPTYIELEFVDVGSPAIKGCKRKNHSFIYFDSKYYIYWCNSYDEAIKLIFWYAYRTSIEKTS